MLIAELLYLRPVSVPAEDALAALRERLPGSRPSESSSEQYPRFAHPQLAMPLSGGGWMLAPETDYSTYSGPASELDRYEFAYREHPAGAHKATTRAVTRIVVSEILSPYFHHRQQRAAALREFVAAFVAIAPPDAIWWGRTASFTTLPGGPISNPDLPHEPMRFAESRAKGRAWTEAIESDPLLGIAAVRAFVQSRDPVGPWLEPGELLVDTRGLPEYDLPDLQCADTGLDASEGVRFLSELVGEYFNRGELDGAEVEVPPGFLGWRFETAEATRTTPGRRMTDVVFGRELRASALPAPVKDAGEDGSGEEHDERESGSALGRLRRRFSR